MTLSDYIDLVATKMHRTDDASKREARKYIQSRYQMIYEGCVWRDVCAAMVVPFESGEQITILPHLVDRVIAVRWSNNFPLRNEPLWTVIEIDANQPDQIRDDQFFHLLSQCACRLACRDADPHGNQRLDLPFQCLHLRGLPKPGQGGGGGDQ
jgi:hypothetical protein